MTGKVVLISGAGSGIGRATAVRFAEAGAHVGITDLDEKSLDETARLVGPGLAAAVSGDIADPATIDELATTAVERFGRVDGLVNNVGILIPQSLMETTVADFDRIMHVNCLSQLLTIQRIVPEMRKSGAGSIVNVSSIGGLVALPGVGVYGASKSAVIGLTRSAAAELAPGIRVNAICPGGVDTAMAAGHIASFEDRDEAISLLTGRQMIPRLARPEEIANVAVFLVSDEASFMTGAVVPVEAGHSAW
ncbi:SDR family oxidoreductase [Nonomuraea monospora]|uniref:SDR family oxidoreductase n=1 Tax=Nonomuraea monospora TaxID=568818 RepID=A0ABP5Q176_9ACTN